MEPHNTYIKTSTDNLIWDNRYSLGSLLFSFEFLYELQSRIARNRAMIQPRFRSAHVPFCLFSFRGPRSENDPFKFCVPPKSRKCFDHFSVFFVYFPYTLTLSPISRFFEVIIMFDTSSWRSRGALSFELISSNFSYFFLFVTVSIR